MATLLASVAFASPAIAGPEAQRLDARTLLIPGGFEPGRQPDGNTVIIEEPHALVVFDTGRHKAQSDAILATAKKLGKPITYIVNSHWHLDHVSGNPRIKAVFPEARVLASDAIDGALTGFLKNSAAQGRKMLAEGKLPAPTLEDLRGDLATIEAGERLKPDHVVTGSTPIPLSRRTVQVRLAKHAATAGDVWIYDWETKRVLAGDLVTLPVPFLDTACPDGWLAALREVDKLPFTSLVPGHGPVMSHDDFRRWFSAFEDFVDCSSADLRPMETCAGGWLAAARHWLGEAEVARASGMAGYYGELIRSGKLAQNCKPA